MSERQSPDEVQKGRITRISVAGFKSIGEGQSIELRPLTIMAGPNSSGKSSLMQPLLLMKQTLEASFDPGVFLLNGPNVKFSASEQLFHRGESRHREGFSVSVTINDLVTITSDYRNTRKGISIKQVAMTVGSEKSKLRPNMDSDQVVAGVAPSIRASVKKVVDAIDQAGFGEVKVLRDRCFLKAVVVSKTSIRHQELLASLAEAATSLLSPGSFIASALRGIIHLPGLRGSPERYYPVTAVSEAFPGTFEKYTASVIAKWQTEKQRQKLTGLAQDLRKLKLTWTVQAVDIAETQVVLQVGRLPLPDKRRPDDLVSVADVGLGVSQTLPVLVALRAAEAGQLVYLEQPEIHLHPRAQTAMAQVLVDAIGRGVQIVVETHSSLLLLGIQTLVAEKKISPEMIKLHWFLRSPSGSTKVTSADIDKRGAFGSWPEDFADVTLEAESRYLDAAEQIQEAG